MQCNGCLAITWIIYGTLKETLIIDWKTQSIIPRRISPCITRNIDTVLLFILSIPFTKINFTHPPQWNGII